MSDTLKDFPDQGNRGRKKSGLRTHQIRILQLLSKNPKGLYSIKTITREAMVDPAWIPSSLYGRLVPGENAIDREWTKSFEEKMGFPSLMTLGYVTMDYIEVEFKKERIFQITPKGLAALKALTE